MPSRSTLLVAGAILLIVFVWSAIHPKDYLTWLLEVFPAIVGIGILAGTYRSFRLTTLVYVLAAIHALILMVGGHYTYAEVPLFNWIRDTFHHARNNYDKVGHFAQGFVPAVIVREVLLRTSPLRRGKWLAVLVVAVCLAISALYELLEWWVAFLSGSAADAFLGSQGDIWDTQSDMALALIGATLSLMLFSRLHDRQLERMNTGRLPARPA